MATHILKQVREAVSHLNPHEVREIAERPLAIRLAAASSGGYATIEDYLSPPAVSRNKRWELVQALYREGDPGAPDQFDLEIYEEGLPRPVHAFSFSPESPERMVAEILQRKEELGLPLARYFQPFRGPVVDKVITTICRENALFSMATALPDIAPGLLEFPWAISEFASDTAFLTVNQIRMTFLLGAASDRPVGYREQKAEIASIIAGAFGWRALARELAGKIPFGGGLIPKAAIAFAGTYVVGSSIERLYRLGYGYSRSERRRAYEDALHRGREVAGALLEGWRSGRKQETGPDASPSN
jgi:hypothetical protein